MDSARTDLPSGKPWRSDPSPASPRHAAAVIGAATLSGLPVSLQGALAAPLNALGRINVLPYGGFVSGWLLRSGTRQGPVGSMPVIELRQAEVKSPAVKGVSLRRRKTNAR